MPPKTPSLLVKQLRNFQPFNLEKNLKYTVIGGDLQDRAAGRVVPNMTVEGFVWAGKAGRKKTNKRFSTLFMNIAS